KEHGEIAAGGDGPSSVGRDRQRADTHRMTNESADRAPAVEIPQQQTRARITLRRQSPVLWKRRDRLLLSTVLKGVGRVIVVEVPESEAIAEERGDREPAVRSDRERSGLMRRGTTTPEVGPAPESTK